MTESTDPRLSEAHIRRVPGIAGDVTIVGVVHGHPASSFRARSVVERTDPAVVALELPPLALPWFLEKAGRDEPTSGEMIAGIRAAADAEIHGIDGPSPGFARHLARIVANDLPSLETLWRTVRSALVAGIEAARCRIASYGFHAPSGGAVTSGTFEVSADDPPSVQANDERRHVHRANSVLETFGTTDAARLRDDAREAHMIDRLDRLSARGDVVAIVGCHHLEALAEGLRG